MGLRPRSCFGELRVTVTVFTYAAHSCRHAPCRHLAVPLSVCEGDVALWVAICESDMALWVAICEADMALWLAICEGDMALWLAICESDMALWVAICEGDMALWVAICESDMALWVAICEGDMALWLAICEGDMALWLAICEGDMALWVAIREASQPNGGEICSRHAKAHKASRQGAQKKLFGARGHRCEDNIKINHNRVLGSVVVDLIRLAHGCGPVADSC
jgi:ketosteroid isomerase-like protein